MWSQKIPSTYRPSSAGAAHSSRASIVLPAPAGPSSTTGAEPSTVSDASRASRRARHAVVRGMWESDGGWWTGGAGRFGTDNAASRFRVMAGGVLPGAASERRAGRGRPECWHARASTVRRAEAKASRHDETGKGWWRTAHRKTRTTGEDTERQDRHGRWPARSSFLYFRSGASASSAEAFWRTPGREMAERVQRRACTT